RGESSVGCWSGCSRGSASDSPGGASLRGKVRCGVPFALLAAARIAHPLPGLEIRWPRESDVEPRSASGRQRCAQHATQEKSPGKLSDIRAQRHELRPQRAPITSSEYWNDETI